MIYKFISVIVFIYFIYISIIIDSEKTTNLYNSYL